MVLKDIWAGQGCVLRDLHILTHFVSLTTLWGPYYYCPRFVPTKTEMPGKRRDLLHHLADNEANWDSSRRPLGSRGCIRNSYFFGRRCQPCLLMVMPLSLAEGNETSFHSAGSNFSLRKCRYSFFRSDCQWGGAPLRSDVATVWINYVFGVNSLAILRWKARSEKAYYS